MKYYLFSAADVSDPIRVGYVLRTGREDKWPWPEGRWSPSKDLIYMSDNPSGYFDEATKREMPKLTAILRPKVKELPDMLGRFSFGVADLPPLVTQRLKDLLEEFSPNCCEYVPGPEIWDATFEREVDRTKYQFANMVFQVDGWDHDLSDIRRNIRANGTPYHSLVGIGTVNSTKVGGHHIWRDSYTKHVLCSDEFKSRVEAANIKNIGFFPLNSTGE